MRLPPATSAPNRRLFHARQYLQELAATLCPGSLLRKRRWLGRKLRWLDKGQIHKLVTAIRAAVDRYPEAADTIRLESNYFDRKWSPHALPRVPSSAVVRWIGRDYWSTRHEAAWSSQICRTPKKTKRQAGGLSYCFGSIFRFTTGCLRESNELSVRVLLDAPLYSALSS